MTIKSKLQSFGIDCDKDKDAIALAKKVLTAQGIKADRISFKIDDEGEKILQDAFKDKIDLLYQKKSIKAPTTKKSDDEAISTLDVINKGKELKKEIEIKKDMREEKKENVVEEKNEDNGNNEVPFWKSNLKNKGLKIKIKGKEEPKEPPKPRPLPQETIDAFNKKKQEINNKNEEMQKKREQKLADMNKNVNGQQNQQNHQYQQNQQNQHNHQKQQFQQGQQKKFDQKTNVKGKNINIKVTNNSHQNSNHQNNFGNNKNNNDYNKNKQQNHQNNKSNQQWQKRDGQKNGNFSIPNKGGTNKSIMLNQSNAAIATGTNNRFDGKKKDKDKYNKNFDNKNQNQKSPKPKNKGGKYTINANNYQKMDETYRKSKKKGAGAFIKPVKVEVPQDDIKSITLPDTIIIKDFASKLKLQPSVIIKKLIMQGKMVTVNDELTYEEAENVALEYNILCEKEVKINVIEELLKENEENEADLVERPPVVCVMGHVDHGKTSILDAIRETNVIEKEAGGITQKIGAYQVKVKDRLITFLDTPGHEAFTAMRLRGAKSTDIAVLVVAADDGVMPQTVEAINHAKAANVEVVVCINKIDIPEANPDKIINELAKYELIPESYGGQTIFCETSAKKNIGIQNLLEMILLTADVLELKANPNRKARGIVIESQLDKGKGPVATILVQKGTLKNGDFVAMGASYGKIRAMMDYNGKKVDKATPSMPVEILGLNTVPQAGDTFICFDNEKEARTFAETFISENKIKMVEESKHKVTLDQLFESIKAGEIKELPIIIKADVAGSTEAVKQSLEKLSNEEVKVKVIHEGVGNITESDVSLASTSNAIIIGFNIKVEPNAKSIISREKVDIRVYDVIYKAIEDVEKAMKGMFAPVYEEKILGNLTIRQIFKASSVGLIAGCFVNDGEIRRNCKVRVKRADKVLYDGDLLSLKRFKDEVKEVKAGFECGVVIDGFKDFMVEDIIEPYIMEEKKMD